MTPKAADQGPQQKKRRTVTKTAKTPPKKVLLSDMLSNLGSPNWIGLSS